MKKRIVRLLNVSLCESCRFGGVTVIGGERYIDCKRLDCDNHINDVEPRLQPILEDTNNEKDTK